MAHHLAWIEPHLELIYGSQELPQEMHQIFCIS